MTLTVLICISPALIAIGFCLFVIAWEMFSGEIPPEDIEVECASTETEVHTDRAAKRGRKHRHKKKRHSVL
jgi:hypothetical protein